ncbi:hypothetical protein D3C78_996820 [compost metagenome]
MVDQRRAAVVLVALHLADHDPVVAAVDVLEVAALEVARAAIEHRGVAQAAGVFDAGELVFLRAGEVVGQGDLVRGEQVDGEVAGGLEHLPGAGALVQAPEDQRRLEGHRVEAVGGDADLVPVRAAGGDDGHPAGEVAEGAAKLAGVHAVLCSSHEALLGSFCGAACARSVLLSR